MKRFIRTLVVALAATLAVAAQAQTNTMVVTEPINLRWESGQQGLGAAGAAITYSQALASPTKGVVKRLTIVCDNSLNASTTGTLTISFLEADCSTVAGKFTVTCANSGTNGGYTFVQIASDQPGVSTTGLTQIPIDPPYCLGVSLAAAGSVSRQVSIYGRP